MQSSIQLARDKLKEEFQVMRYKVRFLQTPERQRLPKLKENSKLIQFKKQRKKLDN
jgi:hypothetical protein